MDCFIFLSVLLYVFMQSYAYCLKQCDIIELKGYIFLNVLLLYDEWLFLFKRINQRVCGLANPVG